MEETTGRTLANLTFPPFIIDLWEYLLVYHVGRDLLWMTDYPTFAALGSLSKQEGCGAGQLFLLTRPGILTEGYFLY